MLARLKKSRSVVDLDELQKQVDTLLGIAGSASRVLLWGIVLMLILRNIGVDIAPLIAGAGIIGLAVGFGAQELVRDVISGFFMLLENQIRAGDVAIINGTGGLVENVGLRTTVLRDLSGVVHVFQNGKINTLSNMTKDWSAMVFDVGVAYKEDTDVVTEVMNSVAEELQADPAYADKIKEPLEIFGVDSFGDSAVVIKARLKTRPIQQWAVGREYRRRLKKAFDEKGIEIPFPHRTLYWGEGENPLVRLGAEGTTQRTTAS
jgi:small conductance mechanosensitive channel